MSMFTKKQEHAKIHVLPLWELNFDKIHRYIEKLGWPISRAVAIKPTGWSYQQKPKKQNSNQIYQKDVNYKGNISIWGMPYSEHSSFTELGLFVKSLQANSIIPTVNTKDTGKMQVWLCKLL
uniref:DNA repair metallo-beta-lactamase domain-containing protein n=1 Tax=Arcella intermedia TaxID=1963864 RepID=A0A6B2LLT6_9EUKA